MSENHHVADDAMDEDVVAHKHYKVKKHDNKEHTLNTIRRVHR